MRSMAGGHENYLLAEHRARSLKFFEKRRGGKFFSKKLSPAKINSNSHTGKLLHDAYCNPWVTPVHEKKNILHAALLCTKAVNAEKFNPVFLALSQAWRGMWETFDKNPAWHCPTSFCRTVFLDRDGVINQDSERYIKSWDEFVFIPNSINAIQRLTCAGYRVIVISNQSVIGRGMVSPQTLADMHRRMRSAVEHAGGRINDIFFCPHTPEDRCDCRKPRPGLFFRAQARHGLDLSASWMVGDSFKDMLAAKNAGVVRRITVRTGNGMATEKEIAMHGLYVDFVADDLLAAARYILAADGT